MQELDLQLRTRESYDVAHRAIETLKGFAVWPTPINYELSLHVVSDPTGPLASAVQRLMADGDLHSDDFSDKLAREFLPRLNLQHEICDAGDALARELVRVGKAIGASRSTQTQVSQALVCASAGLDAATSLPDVRSLIEAAQATMQAADARARSSQALLEASAAEVTRLQRVIERSRREGMTDPLTRLANRRAFDWEIERACAESDAQDSPLILVMIDIDHFKRFNDTWGHQTGDQVIRYIGSLLKAFGTPPRIAARYGGEEFAVIMARESLAQAVSHVEGLRAEVNRRPLRQRTTGAELGRVTLSFGVAQRGPAEAAADLIGRADAALYASKHGGRNTVTTAPACERKAS